MISIEEFRFYDVISRTMMVEEGCYRIFAGPSSAQPQLEAFVEIPGRKPGLRDLKNGYRQIIMMITKISL